MQGKTKQELFSSVFEWIEQNSYASRDVCDVTSLPLYQNLQQINYEYRLGKYMYAPFYRIYKNKPDLIRRLSGLKPFEFPQAYALMIQAFIRYSNAADSTFKPEVIHLMLDRLESLSSAEQGYYAWGQPYNWYSRKRIPAFTPRTTVTTQAGQAFLDAFDYFQEEQYLRIAEMAGNFLIEKMNWSTDAEGDICFPYTTKDNYHIHNANVLGSAFLARLASLTGKEHFFDKAHKSFRFTAKHQHSSGSWYYWAPPDKLLKKIDHYHTGFVLESYHLGKKYWDGSFPFEKNLQLGMEFYLDQLFEENTIPKMTPESKFPIDIQSCAQAIITIGEVMAEGEDKKEWLARVADWTLQHMYNKEDHYFYYRIYKNRVDKTPYLRWGQSWMLRAITYLD